MPHQCTNCGHTFPDGSKEMLSGCPDCGGNKFQFKPSGSQSNTDSQPTDGSTGESVTIDPSTTETASADRQTSPPETEGVDGEATAIPADQPSDSSTEAPAQSSARSDVVSSSEVTAAGSMGPQSESAEASTTEASTAEASTATESTGAPDEPGAEPAVDTEDTAAEESNLDQLRKELNNQFESIRIVSPGQYELNLMELYDRDEYIISLREDGRYVIEVPDSWGDDTRS